MGSIHAGNGCEKVVMISRKCWVMNRFLVYLKNKSYQLFKELGIDTTFAIRIFLTQIVANNGFTFEITGVTAYGIGTNGRII